jgi:hypothetical protein
MGDTLTRPVLQALNFCFGSIHAHLLCSRLLAGFSNSLLPARPSEPTPTHALVAVAEAELANAPPMVAGAELTRAPLAEPAAACAAV